MPGERIGGFPADLLAAQPRLIAFREWLQGSEVPHVPSATLTRETVDVVVGAVSLADLE